jgi:hypothetical protein
MPNEPYQVREIETGETVAETLRVARHGKLSGRRPSPTGDRVLFVARRQPDATYSIALTEEGVENFETALGIADDFGGKTRISPQSTISDIMERTATREELSRVLRQGGSGYRSTCTRPPPSATWGTGSPTPGGMS